MEEPIERPVLLRDIGEKRLISDHLIPLLNPMRDALGIGDDCGFIAVDGTDQTVCVTTDRVPADLISYRLKLISNDQLGYYLGILNLSDLAACGALPRGLLLNVAAPPACELSSLLSIVAGVARAASDYGCQLVGGDLSTSVELNLVATAIGISRSDAILLRTGAKAGDIAFCSDTVGLTPTAFQHFLADDAVRALLDARSEQVLADCFRAPMARVALGKQLAESRTCSSVMDNTDGLAQSLSELAALNSVCIAIDADSLPISPISLDVAQNTGTDVLDLVLGPGADFQLVGTVRSGAVLPEPLKRIGEVREGSGLVLVRDSEEAVLVAKGWNYFTPPL